MGFGARQFHRRPVGVPLREKAMHDDILAPVPVQVGHPGVFPVVGQFDRHLPGLLGEQLRTGHAGVDVQFPVGPLDQQVRSAVSRHVPDEPVLVERAPVVAVVVAKGMPAAQEHDVQGNPARFPRARGAVQLDAPGRGGPDGGASRFHPVEGEIQPDVVPHEALDPLEEAAFEVLTLDRGDDQTGFAISAEIHAFHGELDVPL